MKDTVDKLLSELRDDPEAFAKSGVAADGLDAMLAELREPMELTDLVVDELRKHKPGVAMAALAMIIPITLAAVPDELRDLFLARVEEGKLRRDIETARKVLGVSDDG